MSDAINPDSPRKEALDQFLRRIVPLGSDVREQPLDQRFSIKLI
jgi:hypothetical protein